ncbi:hypothetical protein D5086_015239 [Populus alba]|uniref:Uncharacterized protein n=1 Tax=Populus alba TaxID=43335 RepID=A0ACC4C2L7_POPAL
MKIRHFFFLLYHGFSKGLELLRLPELQGSSPRIACLTPEQLPYHLQENTLMNHLIECGKWHGEAEESNYMTPNTIDRQ